MGDVIRDDDSAALDFKRAGSAPDIQPHKGSGNHARQVATKAITPMTHPKNQGGSYGFAKSWIGSKPRGGPRTSRRMIALRILARERSIAPND